MEVSDDGVGVPVESRPYLATPHATSKLRSFADMSSGIRTLGFRGEALFSLANLSGKLIVATRTADEPLATKLEFRRDGSVDPAGMDSFQKKVGTTVAVVGFLEAVPVRRQDAIRRISQQRAKLVHWMEAYAIFSVGVKLHLMDMVGTSCRESTILCTTLNASTMEETISCVLGTKFLNTLCPLRVDLRPEASADGNGDEKASEKDTKDLWVMHGMVSKAGPSSSERVSRDRQYFCLNGRPVELPKVARTLNAAWKSLPNATGRRKRPSWFLHLQIPPCDSDVNLTPDKRQVMLSHEEHICNVIGQSVATLWSAQIDGHFTASQLSVPDEEDVDYDSPTLSEDEFGEDDNDSRPQRFNRRYAFSHDLTRAKLQHEYDDGRQIRPTETNTSKPGAVTPYQNQEHNSNKINDLEEKKQETFEGPLEKRLKVDTQHKETESATASASDSPQLNPVTPSPGNGANPDAYDLAHTRQPFASDKVSSDKRMITEVDEGKSIDEEDIDNERPVPADRPTPSELRRWRAMQRSFNQEQSTTDAAVHVDPQQKASPTLDAEIVDIRDAPRYGLERFGFGSKKKTNETRSLKPSAEMRPPSMSLRQTVMEQVTKGTTSVSAASSSFENTQSGTMGSRRSPPRREPSSVVNWEEEGANIASEPKPGEKMQTLEEEPEARDEAPQAPVVWENFRGTEDVVLAARKERLSMRKRRRGAVGTTVQNTSENDDQDYGEEHVTNSEESKASIISLSKDNFRDMKVIGQFNLGFILATTPDNNLWILDQHACDEKYNFEKLCRETVIHEQRLIAPMKLELTPAEETCVLDNMDLFEKNGFRFEVDLDQPPRHRLKLTALPHSGARDGRKAVQFGKDDVSALCAILGVDDSSAEDAGDWSAGSGTGTDGSGMHGNNAVRRYAGSGMALSQNETEKILVRLPKAVAMFASRACRGSIMIGTALSEKEMDRIVKRLAEVEHPWNCPHGRPTMRHVGNLQAHFESDDKKARERIASATITMCSQEEHSMEDQD